MTRKLQSLLEMMIVVGGLAATPIFVATSFGTIIAAVQSEPVAATAVQDVRPNLPATNAGF
jgi:hypothetical protein